MTRAVRPRFLGRSPPTLGITAMRAADVMTSPAVTVTPETTVKVAARLMAERHVSGLPVVDGREELVGIVSEADLLRLETETDPRSLSRPAHTADAPRLIADVMTREVVTVDESTDVGLCVQRMLEAGVKRVPVMRGRVVAGVLSRHDLMTVLARDDAEIQTEVERRLRSEEGISGVVVGVRDGIVTLGGLADPVAMRLAESLARGVPGVLAVRTAAR